MRFDVFVKICFIHLLHSILSVFLVFYQWNFWIQEEHIALIEEWFISTRHLKCFIYFSATNMESSKKSWRYGWNLRKYLWQPLATAKSGKLRTSYDFHRLLFHEKKLNALHLKTAKRNRSSKVVHSSSWEVKLLSCLPFVS